MTSVTFTKVTAFISCGLQVHRNTLPCTGILPKLSDAELLLNQRSTSCISLSRSGVCADGTSNAYWCVLNKHTPYVTNILRFIAMYCRNKLTCKAVVPNTVYSCKRHDVIAARLAYQRRGNVIAKHLIIWQYIFRFSVDVFETGWNGFLLRAQCFPYQVVWSLLPPHISTSCIGRGKC
jgi:hypothetical protein